MNHKELRDLYQKLTSGFYDPIAILSEAINGKWCCELHRRTFYGIVEDYEKEYRKIADGIHENRDVN